MRHFILAGSVALCLTSLSAPASGTGMLTPLQVTGWHQEERSNATWPVMDMDWQWDPELSWLTFPDYPPDQIGPDDQNICPLGTKGEQLIGMVAHRGQTAETQLSVRLAADEQSRS